MSFLKLMDEMMKDSLPMEIERHTNMTPVEVGKRLACEIIEEVFVGRVMHKHEFNHLCPGCRSEDKILNCGCALGRQGIQYKWCEDHKKHPKQKKRKKIK